MKDTNHLITITNLEGPISKGEASHRIDQSKVGSNGSMSCMMEVRPLTNMTILIEEAQTLTVSPIKETVVKTLTPMDNQELLVDQNQLEDHLRLPNKEPGKKTKISNVMSPTLLMKKSFKIVSSPF